MKQERMMVECDNNESKYSLLTSSLSSSLSSMLSLSESSESLRQLPDITASTDASLCRSSTTKLKRRGMSVRFDLDQNTVQMFHTLPDMSADEVWFTTDDHNTMKAQSRTDSREWRKYGYHILLNDSYECPDQEQVQDYLNAFVQLPDRYNRRGLERQCSRKHGEERSKVKETSRQIVFQRQEEYMKQNLCHSDECIETVSLCYMRACRSAKDYARRMGKADEIEIQRLNICIQFHNNNSCSSIWNEQPSEVVERVFEQNGIVSPYGVQRHRSIAHRRLSNFSAASVNSYDSQPLYSMLKMKNNASDDASSSIGSISFNSQTNICNDDVIRHTHYANTFNHVSPIKKERRFVNNNNSIPSITGSKGRKMDGPSCRSSANSHSAKSISGRRRFEGGPLVGMGDEYYAAIA